MILIEVQKLSGKKNRCERKINECFEVVCFIENEISFVVIFNLIKIILIKGLKFIFIDYVAF